MIEKAPDEASRDSYFERLGRVMATMHDQATAWQPPSQFQRHSLDADGFMGEAPFAKGCVAGVDSDISVKRASAAVRARVRKRSPAFFAKFRAGLVLVRAGRTGHEASFRVVR